MFKKDSYPATQTGEIKRTFMFTDPYPTTKIMLDQLKGTPTVAVKVELLGAEFLSNFDDPFGPGFQTESKKLMCFTIFFLGSQDLGSDTTDSSTVTLASSICPGGYIHAALSFKSRDATAEASSNLGKTRCQL